MVLKPGIRIGLFVPSFFVAESALALNYLIEIEKKYNSRIVLFFLERSSLESLKDIVSNSDLIESVYVVKDWERYIDLYNEDGAAGVWRFFRSIVMEAGYRKSVEAIVAPVCQDFLAFLETTAFLQGKIDGLGESRLALFNRDKNVAFINGFHEVPCVESSFLSYKKYPSLYIESLSRRGLVRKNIYDVYSWKILQDSVGVESGEILFSIHKTSEWILGESLKKKTCKYCGGFASNENICIWCRKITDFVNRENLEIDIEEVS